MIFATQYYRPPFPHRERWLADLRQIRDTGFNAIYVSVPWSWVEPDPGSFVFDDFDELFEMAREVGLRVIPNLFVEVQPLWIHRVVPDSHMIDHTGRHVLSSQLAYFNSGLTPGGCTDHPEVRSRATRFLAEFVSRYAAAQNLLAWDCWNEIRWMTQADGYVCHCEHTIEAFRSFIRERVGDLDALNTLWQRRYSSWEDVVPSKGPARTPIDAIEFQRFLTRRAAVDLKWRSEVVREADPAHPVIAHAAFPSVYLLSEFLDEPALARGNDWELAEIVDGWGCSHFPGWIHTSPVDYAARLEASRCAAGSKTYWIAELQGGAAGHGLQAMEPVPGAVQARWIWNGIGRGAKAVNFWCWRDEVFGRESAGFGIVGEDGYREDRLAHLERTASILQRNDALLDAYEPAPANAAVVFEPGTYHHDWATTLSRGLPGEPKKFQAAHSLQGYLRAFERVQVPYDVIEAGRLGDLANYRLVVVPWPLMVRPTVAEALISWVRAGGTLLVEAGLDAFDEAGFYRYPEERPFAEALGLTSEGRRPIRDLTISSDAGDLRTSTWLEPLEDGALLVKRTIGAGNVVAVGSFVGLAYWEERYPEFERFLLQIVDAAGANADLRCDGPDGEIVQWRAGHSGETLLLFATNAGDETRVTFSGAALSGRQRAEDLASGEMFGIDGTLEFTLDEGGYRVLALQ